jgi:predicted dehydrogenase
MMCVHNWKQAPSYRRAHELVQSGRLGGLRYLSIERLRSGPAGAGGSRIGGERWRLSAKTGGGILIDHGWHVFYLMRWLMDANPIAVSAYLDWQPHSAGGDSDRPDDIADLRVEFPRGRTSHVHLSWRSPVRRTSALLYGELAMLEIEGDRVLLTERSGKSEVHSVADMPDDSYHSAWFGGMAAEFERAICEGPDGPTVRENHAEIRAALALSEGARRSATDGLRTLID